MPEKTAKPPAKRTRTTARATTRKRKGADRTPDRSQIAERAYFIHLEGGVDEVGNWLRAERELTAA